MNINFIRGSQLLLLLSFFTFLSLPGVSQVKSIFGDRMTKIQIMIPPFSCIDSTSTKSIDSGFRKYLNEFNRSLLQGVTEEDPTTLSIQKVLDACEQYDDIKLTTVTLFLASLSDNLYQGLTHAYEDEERFHMAHDYLITEGKSEDLKTMKEYQADFKISFDTIFLSSPDTITAKVSMETPNQGITTTEYSTFINLGSNKLLSYCHDLYANLTQPLADAIATVDPVMKTMINLYHERKEVLDSEPTIDDIVSGLRKIVLAENPELKHYHFIDGITNKDSSIFQGIFFRIFEDTTGQDYAATRIKEARELFGGLSISIDSITMRITALKKNNKWFYLLTSSGTSFDKVDFSIEKLNLNKFNTGIRATLSTDQYFLKGTANKNPNYFQELYYLQPAPGQDEPRIISEYNRRATAKREALAKAAFLKSLYENHFRCIYEQTKKSSSLAIEDFLFHRRLDQDNKHIFFMSPDSSDILLVSTVKQGASIQQILFYFNTNTGVNYIYDDRTFKKEYSSAEDFYRSGSNRTFYEFKILTNNKKSLSTINRIIDNPRFWQNKVHAKNSDGTFTYLKELKLDCR